MTYDNIDEAIAAVREAATVQLNLRGEVLAQQLLGTLSQADKDTMAMRYALEHILEARRDHAARTRRAALREALAQGASSPGTTAPDERERAREEDLRWAQRWQELKEEEDKTAIEALPGLFVTLRDDPVGLYVSRDVVRRVVDDGESHSYVLPKARAQGHKSPKGWGRFPHPGYCVAGVGHWQCNKFPEPDFEFCSRHGKVTYTVHRPVLPRFGAHRHFAEWLGGEDAFQKWLRWSIPQFKSGPGIHAQMEFLMDWYPGGPVRQCVDEAFATIRAQARLEITTELLGSEFTLKDGRRVTWADATRADHRERIDMALTGATASMEDAARHEMALKLLDERGIDRLGQAQGAGGER